MKNTILSILVLCFLAPQGPVAFAVDETLSKEDMLDMLERSNDLDSAESAELLNARDRAERDRRRAEEERRRRDQERRERRRQEEERERRQRERRREQERRERQREEERQRERERERQRARERERQRERERERERERQRERDRARERERERREWERRERERREQERRERERRERERDRWDDDDDYRRPIPNPPPRDDDGYEPPPRSRFPAEQPTCDEIGEQEGLCTVLRLSYERPHITYNLDKGDHDTSSMRTVTLKSAANTHASPGMILGVRVAYVEFESGYRQDLVADAKALYPQNISPKGNLFLGLAGEIEIPLDDEGKISRIYVHADSWIEPGVDAFMAVILE